MLIYRQNLCFWRWTGSVNQPQTITHWSRCKDWRHRSYSRSSVTDWESRGVKGVYGKVWYLFKIWVFSRAKKVTFSSFLHTVWDVDLWIFTDSTFSDNYSSQNGASTLLFEWCYSIWISLFPRRSGLYCSLLKDTTHMEWKINNTQK